MPTLNGSSSNQFFGHPGYRGQYYNTDMYGPEKDLNFDNRSSALPHAEQEY